MSYIVSLKKASTAGISAVGGKACALSRLMNTGVSIANGICITTAAYKDYMTETGLGNQISALLMRKQFEDMRWEEIWDIALRIRNQFLQHPIPEPLKAVLLPKIKVTFSDKPVAVRSSAPEEDAGSSSFAGLHDSSINISGADNILQHVLLVWASLWSDRALLYRKELGLQTNQSAMGVILQEMIIGDRSGIAFTQHPSVTDRGVIEGVYGLNQGLVDGTVEPDRWIINKSPLHIFQRQEAVRTHALRPAAQGVTLMPLDAREQTRPPLAEEEALHVFRQALKVEQLFGMPQDTEWTLRADAFYLLQARPITRINVESEDDVRSWYLSLSRRHETLGLLVKRIEREILPAMETETTEWATINLNALRDDALAAEIIKRKQRVAHWEAVYKKDFIPFAHGMRLFGQFYNDAVKPEDPYAFMELLSGADLISKHRNRELEALATMLRHDPKLAAVLRKQESLPETCLFVEKLETLIADFGDTTWGEVRLAQDRGALIRLLLTMAEQPPQQRELSNNDADDKVKEFLGLFDDNTMTLAKSLLDIGRASYRLRDNDNIYLGRLQGQLLASVVAGCSRIKTLASGNTPKDYPPEEIAKALTSPAYIPKPSQNKHLARTAQDTSNRHLKARQIVGQPASRGIGIGTARVVTAPEALFEFKAGEVLVCDAIDPNMTFIVPLAAGIVERRGGMLIHGAIIAREYGIPCVTGVPDATNEIRTGEQVAVDGHLGIVVIG